MINVISCAKHPCSAAESQDRGEGGLSGGAGVPGHGPPAPTHPVDKRGESLNNEHNTFCVLTLD